MNIKQIFTLLRYRHYKISYSQCGEDRIIDCALYKLGIKKPNYLDIGTNHPVKDNNTFLFYSRGGQGICIEPNFELFKIIKQTRGRDVCLNIGVGPSDETDADYYMMSSNSLNTFRRDEADKYAKEQNYGKQAIKKVIQVPLVTINRVMQKYFPTGVDLLSLDTEGYDLEIIKSLDLQSYRPKIICIETLRYNNDGALEKVREIAKHLTDHNYFLYGDTFVNSIFIDEKQRNSLN